MNYSLGDLADRFTINIRKQRLLSDQSFIKEIGELREAIIKILESKQDNMTQFIQDLVELSDINNSIWEMEFKVRQGKEEELGLAIIGSRALKIRDLNSIRVKIKNRMNQYSNTGFTDVKIGHCSEEVSK